ncbi:50S ribosomal protein L32 [bacterium]|nr:50S ribosomal protein L32 [bacterium]
MAVPKRRKSHSRVRTQRAHKAMTAVQHQYCTSCGAPTLPHRACPACGHYQKRFYVKSEES